MLLMWSILCPLKNNKCRKFHYSRIAFFGDEHLDKILRASVMQSPLMICGGLYEKGLGYEKKEMSFL
jgi:hypothetical protein